MSVGNTPPGFKLPVNIPGAPERVTLPELIETARPLLVTSFDAFQRKPGAYEAAHAQANWWHFWILVAASSLISAVASAFTVTVLQVQLGLGGINLLELLLFIAISVPISFLAFYAGCYASYWWAVNQAGGQAPLVAHSYLLIVIWAAENILAAILTLVLSFIGLTQLGLMITVIIAIYALVVMTGHISRLYQFPERGRTWSTAAVMVVTTWMMGVLLQGFLL